MKVIADAQIGDTFF
jgi:translation elongation factor EF-4